MSVRGVGPAEAMRRFGWGKMTLIEEGDPVSPLRYVRGDIVKVLGRLQKNLCVRSLSCAESKGDPCGPPNSFSTIAPQQRWNVSFR